MTLIRQTQQIEAARNVSQRLRLPRRDYVLLPLIFFGTMLTLLLCGEVAGRLIYIQDDAAEPCEYVTPGGARYHPGCVSRTKVWEGPWITQRFNDCGYRTAESCAPRPPGALRIAVVGSSTARGALVNYDDSFAARVSAWLSDRCGGPVDVQNLGTEPTDVDRVDQRIPEALALKPSAIVLTVGPYDLVHLKDPPPGADVPGHRLNPGSVMVLLRQSRLFLLLQYYLYRDPSFQIRAFLLNGDAAGYVRGPLDAAWRQRVDDFAGLLHRVAAETTSAAVPVLLVYIPERAQAALAARPSRPFGVDPFVLQAALAGAAEQAGVRFVDATPDFASAPDFQSLFYLTDGHPREGGHAAIAAAVEQALLPDPAFSRCHAK
jgi:hypothetical protein